MQLPLETALGGLIAGAGLLVALRSGAEAATRWLAVILVVLAGALLLAPPIDRLQDLLTGWRLLVPLHLVSGGLAILVGYRSRAPWLATLLSGAGVALALRGAGLLGGWAL
jgi:hypothetical protein